MTARGKMSIVNAGPLSTVQDLGRMGKQHLGFTQCGAADEYAYLWANTLLDNNKNCACIEITLGPFEALFSHATQIAITGAKTDIRINDKYVNFYQAISHPHWQTYKIEAGDRIKIAMAQRGLRVYLAIYNGFDVNEVLGSRSMNVREQLGFNHGQPLTASIDLPYDQHTQRTLTRAVPPRFVPKFSKNLNLHLFPGYQYSQFDPEQLALFFSRTYYISAQSDRMGYRLSGEAIKQVPNSLLSEGIAYGSVQVPPDGQPIILLNDRQTIGGYPKLGCIAKLDGCQLSQCRPGDSVKFVLANCDEAQSEYQQVYQYLKL